MYLKDQIYEEQVSDWSMPSAYIKLFLQHATAEGLLVQPLLSGTGLEPDKLLHSDLPVTFQQTRKVLPMQTELSVRAGIWPWAVS